MAAFSLISNMVKTLGSPPTVSRVCNAPTWHCVTGGSSTFGPPHESREGKLFLPQNKPLETRISNIFLSSLKRGGDADDDDDEEDVGPEATSCRARLGTHGRGNSRPLANLPFPVFPERCDAPPELPRATADVTRADASFERGNAGPDGNSHLRDSSKQWDLVKMGRTQS